ncbi:hypothetical protein ACFWWS_28150 [Streptomyces sp. NPDC059083]|uniref:hypothetical protein n=1 Tax=unclassified Streptomyces TaxID=2593676 RepID=UPI0036AA7094
MVKKYENENDSARTTPSRAPGESGDEEAREEAEDAVLPGTGAAEADDVTPGPKAQPPAREDEIRKPHGP